MNSVTPSLARNIPATPLLPSAQVTKQAVHMPDPAHLYDRRWKKLPLSLEAMVLSRFAQNMCSQQYGIGARAMCLGLSLIWLKDISCKRDLNCLDDSIRRMRYLASFDGVVHARIIHNFYTAEHKYLIQHPDPHSVPTLTGSTSLMAAASQLELTLHLQTNNTDQQKLPLLQLDDQRPQANAEVLDELRQMMINGSHGLLALVGSNQSHIVGFSVINMDNQRIIVFDSNLGEFDIPLNRFNPTIQNIAQANEIKLVGAQVWHE